MAKKTTERELWKDIPDEHDFPAGSHISSKKGAKLLQKIPPKPLNRLPLDQRYVGSTILQGMSSSSLI